MNTNQEVTSNEAPAAGNGYGIDDADLNPQGIFNKVVRHLVKQNTRAIWMGGALTGACVLRDAEGRACAVGCLLRDDELPKDRPNETAAQTCERLPRFAPFETLLSALQNVHDSPPERWDVGLLDVAVRFNLAMPSDEAVEVTP